jgi:AbrB family looped-hinge helix DNA binding protein
MGVAQSRVTAQGQISIPARIRQKLGIGPGSILEWDEEGDNIVVRRAGKYTSEDIHKAVFPEGPPAKKSLDELKEGVRLYVKKRHARR